MRVKSSKIWAVEWHDELLDVTFRDGKKAGATYRYFGVPKTIFTLMIHADSIGRYFNAWVEQVGYKYEKIAEPKHLKKETQE